MPEQTAYAPIALGGVKIQFLASGADTQGAMSMFELTVAAGGRVPAPHFHVDVDEVIYGLSGVLTYTVDGATREVRAGESVVSVRGQTHHFENKHAEDAVVLTVQTPGTIGPAYYQELADLLGAGGPPDPAQVKAIMGRYGLEAAV